MKRVWFIEREGRDAESSADALHLSVTRRNPFIVIFPQNDEGERYRLDYDMSFKELRDLRDALNQANLCEDAA